jgi:hypothetical protein
MREWEEEYFSFIEEGIEAANNPAELTIRQSVLDRAVTQESCGAEQERVVIITSLCFIAFPRFFIISGVSLLCCVVLPHFFAEGGLMYRGNFRQPCLILKSNQNGRNRYITGKWLST